MGSRIMHLVISYRIAERFSITDKQAFLLGGIAPDAVSPKGLSHFYEGEHHNFTRKIAYERFYHKYSGDIHQDYILGYYTHLIADDLWLKGFYLPWLKNRMENDENIFTRYHHDFKLLNGKLLDYYGIGSNLLDGMVEGSSIIDIQEVKAGEVKDLLPFVEEDMDYGEKELNEKLTVFTFEQILGYIETAVEKSIFHLKLKG